MEKKIKKINIILIFVLIILIIYFLFDYYFVLNIKPNKKVEDAQLFYNLQNITLDYISYLYNNSEMYLNNASMLNAKKNIDINKQTIRLLNPIDNRYEVYMQNAYILNHNTYKCEFSMQIFDDDMNKVTFNDNYIIIKIYTNRMKYKILDIKISS